VDGSREVVDGRREDGTEVDGPSGVLEEVGVDVGIVNVREESDEVEFAYGWGVEVPVSAISPR
jgi:hypothetical protein